LQILGASWEIYERYASQIRQEYKIHPDFMYRPGRVQALQHFLSRESIFQTNVFREKFEMRARENLKREIKWLNS
jgi:predicted metal-dependent HD superfamily phosphohydrolase